MCVLTIRAKSGDVGWWIGFTDSCLEGTWKWEGNNNHPSYTNWQSGEPNDSLDGEDCGEIGRSNGKWNDSKCGSKMRYICRW